MFESKLDALVRVKVEQTINAMLDAEADEIANAARYERKTDRKAFRAGHYERTLTAKAGKLSLKMPKLKGALFGSAVIERYRRRESSVEEALMEMYLAGVSTRRVDDISQLLWGERMPSQTLSDKLKKIYKEIDEWRKRPLESEYPYVFVDGVWHKRSSMLPNAKYQRCMVHFMRNVPSKTPPSHREWASAALKAIFAQENRESAMAKAGTVAGEMEERKLKSAANCLREGVGETTTYLLPEFPANHGIKLRTNNMIERLNKEIRWRTRVVGGFPDSNSALMLVCARIRYVTSRSWSDRRYMDMSRLDDNLGAAA